MLRMLAEVTGNLDSIKSVGRGLVIGLAAIGPGIGLIEALALFGIAFSFII
jgi:F0F1-type ATP synthase membrane subunit c/vacuolar-type H+-ATPase subunit K